MTNKKTQKPEIGVKKITSNSFEVDIKTVEGKRLTSFNIGVNGKSTLMNLSIFDDGNIHISIHPKYNKVETITVFGKEDETMVKKDWDNSNGKYRSFSLEKEII